jgi:hypothetical protein
MKLFRKSCHIGIIPEKIVTNSNYKWYNLQINFKKDGII